ncbi:protein kinase-like (PK-like) [Purpureocillium lavendulum]|uniref:protein-ribulosamine 3-kinase n=1 Tax=Purpureocillium lavendulum TaxID=1247861 RepID=A0AB34G741_9HYPO|nr:protein kinase-like (PK-like) [Purpureocillium lavendulum]
MSLAATADPLEPSSDAIAPQPPSGDFEVDKNVLRKFPDGTTILSASRFGTSAWTITAKLHLRLPGGAEERYFLKCAPDADGRVLLEGEFNAMSELYKWAPELVPKPHSFGKCASEKPTELYFFLSEYIDMTNRMPDPNQLCQKLARLHRESESPTGKFGFHTTTCQGRSAQCVDWEDNWRVFFTKLLQHVIKNDFELNGHWDELDQLEQRLLAEVVPRLLDALERDGRQVKPCLIHGDLWEGNTGTSLENGNIYIFDAAVFYAHHEMEVADWRCYYNKISNKIYTRTYLRYNSPSEPKAEWEDRNRLYSIYYNIIYSVNHLSQGTAVRQLAYNDMYFLIDKYAPFPDGGGPKRLVDSEMATLSAERDHTV